MLKELVLSLVLSANSAAVFLDSPKNELAPMVEYLTYRGQKDDTAIYTTARLRNDLDIWGLHVKNPALLSDLFPENWTSDSGGQTWFSLFDLFDYSFSFPTHHDFYITQADNYWNAYKGWLYADPQFLTECVDFSQTLGSIIMGKPTQQAGAMVLFGFTGDPYISLEEGFGTYEAWIYFLHPLKFQFTENALSRYTVEQLTNYANAAFDGILNIDDAAQTAWTNGYNAGRADGREIGYNEGRNDAINEMTPQNIFWAWLAAGGETLKSFLDIPIFGNVTIGAIIGVLVGLTLIGFILKMFI